MGDAHFLMVEDSAPDVELAVIVHEACGVALPMKVCRDGQEVMEYLASTPRDALPRFIVTDLKMSRMGGLQMIESLRAQESTRHIPLIVFSSSSERRDVEAAYARGATAYCVKPFGFDAFSKALTTLIHFWGEYSEPR